ncbi:MAG: FAD-binding protein, partial [Streptosporangiaceae bacterium]
QGQQPLISEAVRGEGAYLVDRTGTRFMVGRHELAELAPRDVVAKGIMNRMLETGEPCMYLDGRHLGQRFWEERFPNILASCRDHGVDPLGEPVPVVPAAHYASGGVRTDLGGRTSLPGLYACGEVACTGVHGANRLASNSLLEGLVFAERIARTLQTDLTALGSTPPAALGGDAVAGLLGAGVRAEVQRVMSAFCGVLRTAGGLAQAERELVELGARVSYEPCLETWEATNLHAVATAVVRAARLREETRGSHWREDFPERDDLRWHGHLITRGMTTIFEPHKGA